MAMNPEIGRRSRASRTPAENRKKMQSIEFPFSAPFRSRDVAAFVKSGRGVVMPAEMTPVPRRSIHSETSSNRSRGNAQKSKGSRANFPRLLPYGSSRAMAIAATFDACRMPIRSPPPILPPPGTKSRCGYLSRKADGPCWWNLATAHRSAGVPRSPGTHLPISPDDSDWSEPETALEGVEISTSRAKALEKIVGPHWEMSEKSVTWPWTGFSSPNFEANAEELFARKKEEVKREEEEERERSRKFAELIADSAWLATPPPEKAMEVHLEDALRSRALQVEDDLDAGAKQVGLGLAKATANSRVRKETRILPPIPGWKRASGSIQLKKARVAVRKGLPEPSKIKQTRIIPPMSTLKKLEKAKEEEAARKAEELRKEEEVRREEAAKQSGARREAESAMEVQEAKGAEWETILRDVSEATDRQLGGLEEVKTRFCVEIVINERKLEELRLQALPVEEVEDVEMMEGSYGMSVNDKLDHAAGPLRRASPDVFSLRESMDALELIGKEKDRSGISCNALRDFVRRKEEEAKRLKQERSEKMRVERERVEEKIESAEKNRVAGSGPLNELEVNKATDPLPKGSRAQLLDGDSDYDLCQHEDSELEGDMDLDVKRNEGLSEGELQFLMVTLPIIPKRRLRRTRVSLTEEDSEGEIHGRFPKVEGAAESPSGLCRRRKRGLRQLIESDDEDIHFSDVKRRREDASSSPVSAAWAPNKRFSHLRGNPEDDAGFVHIIKPPPKSPRTSSRLPSRSQESAARRITKRKINFHAVKSFLDSPYLTPASQTKQRFKSEPRSTESKTVAFLASVDEGTDEKPSSKDLDTNSTWRKVKGESRNHPKTINLDGVKEFENSSREKRESVVRVKMEEDLEDPVDLSQMSWIHHVNGEVPDSEAEDEGLELDMESEQEIEGAENEGKGADVLDQFSFSEFMKEPTKELEDYLPVSSPRWSKSPTPIVRFTPINKE